MNKKSSQAAKKQLNKQTKKISDFFSTSSTKGKCKTPDKSEDYLIIESPNMSTSKRKHSGDKTVLENVTNTLDDDSSFKKRKLLEVNESKAGCSKYFIELTSPDTKGSTMSSCIKSSPVSKNLFTSKKHASSPIKITEEEDIVDATPEKVGGMFMKSLKTKTPNKMLQKSKTPSKRTPVKLFSRSPKVADFNVQVIKDFVKITPNKSRSANVVTTPVKSTDKKQKSILDYASPKASRSSAKAQSTNEFTPIQDRSPKKAVPSASKFKMKLDFEEVTTQKSPAKEKENVFPDDDNFDCLFDDDGWFEELDPHNFTLDLTTSQHCKVVQVDQFISKVQIVVESTKTKEKALCNLESFWMQTNLKKDDTIHLSAIKTNNAEWSVNNDGGLLVFEPDLLIASTTLVGSMFCKRKAVFKEHFAGFDGGNKCMMIGNIIHELLEKVLKLKLYSQDEISYTLSEMLSTKFMVKSFYKNQIELEDIKEDLSKYIPNIVDFVEQYVSKSRNVGVKTKSNKNNQNWTGQIDAIQDIEENFWNPELGIKGKVDVTLQVGLASMPLELKTGRATVSLEHRGQVMLYLMMMKNFGYNVKSGLLLYLKEGVLREVSINHREQRDLMILRNELAYYLSSQPKIDEQSKDVKLAELPEPINHFRACDNCEYNDICSTYLIRENADLSNNPKLLSIKQDILKRLKPSHLEYFIHYSNLLQIEFASKSSNKNVRDIYTKSPEDREKDGKCITNVLITNVVEDTHHEFYYTTFKKEQEGINFLTSGINESNYVVVSCPTRSAIVAGFVSKITSDEITLSLDKDIRKKYIKNIFHLDTFDSSIVLSFNMANLAILLQDTERSEQLRNLIIDKTAPTYQQKLTKAIVTKCVPYLKGLNKLQQRAIIKVLTTNEYLLVKGMPGTGKSATLVALIELLSALNYSVLITSHTHSAVDNICLKLKKKEVNFLRLGQKGRINPDIEEFSDYFLTENCTSTQEIDEVYNKFNIVAVTCLGATHPLLMRRTFDICLVDESTQVLQTSVFKVLSTASKFVLFGDPDQLPPIVRSQSASKLGLSESLFQRLHKEDNTITLAYNYRMNEQITKLANGLTYSGELLIGNVEVKNATINIPNIDNIPDDYKKLPWLNKAFDSSMENSVILINTGCICDLNHDILWLKQIQSHEQKGAFGKLINPYETSIIVTLVKILLKCGVPSSSIGVMSPFVLQVSQLSYFLQSLGIEVNSIDQYQGKDKEIIIYSSTKSSKIVRSDFVESHESILDDKRRLTVAITRAKQKLIIISDISSVVQYKPFEKLFQLIDSSNVIDISNEDTGFEWNRILKFHELLM